MKVYKPVPTRIKVVSSPTQTDYWPEYKPFWFCGWQAFNVMWGKPTLHAAIKGNLEIGSLDRAKSAIDEYLREKKEDWDQKYNRTTTYIDYP